MVFSLRQRLEAENGKLFSRLRYIETEARQLWEYSQAGDHAEFTPHGLSHISRVEQNAEIFLSDAGMEDLNGTEVFILLVSIFFHDAFMITRSSGQTAVARRFCTKMMRRVFLPYASKTTLRQKKQKN